MVVRGQAGGIELVGGGGHSTTLLGNSIVSL